MDNNDYSPFDLIAIFNTILGLNNIALNQSQREQQTKMVQQISRIEEKLDKLLEGKEND